MQITSQTSQVNNSNYIPPAALVPSDKMPNDMWQQIYLSCLQFDNCVVALDTAIALSATNKCIRPLFDDEICHAFLQRYFSGPYLREKSPQDIPSLQAWRFALLKDFTYSSPRIPQNQREGKYTRDRSEWYHKGLARTLRGNDYFVISKNRAVKWYAHKEGTLLYTIDSGQPDPVRSIHPDWNCSLSLIDQWLILIEQWNHKSTAHVWNLELIRKGIIEESYGCIDNCWSIQGAGSLVYAMIANNYDPQMNKHLTAWVQGCDLLKNGVLIEGHNLYPSDIFSFNGFCTHEGLLHCIDGSKIVTWQRGQQELIQVETSPIVLEEGEELCALKVCGNRVLAFSRCDQNDSLGLMWYYSPAEHKWHRTAHRVCADRIAPCLQIGDQDWYYVCKDRDSIFCIALDESPSPLASEKDPDEFMTELRRMKISFQGEAHKVILLVKDSNDDDYCDMIYTYDYRRKLFSPTHYNQQILHTITEMWDDSWDDESDETWVATLQEYLQWFSFDPFSAQAVQQVFTKLLFHIAQTTKDLDALEAKIEGILKELPEFCRSVSMRLKDEKSQAGKVLCIQEALKNWKNFWCLAGVDIITEYNYTNVLKLGGVALDFKVCGVHSNEDAQLLGIDTTQESLVDDGTSDVVLCERLERLLATVRSWQKSDLFRCASQLEARPLQFKARPFFFDVEELESLKQQIEACLQTLKAAQTGPAVVDTIHELIKRHGNSRAFLEQISGRIETQLHTLQSKIDKINELIKRYNAFKYQHEFLKIVAYASVRDTTNEGTVLKWNNDVMQYWVFLREERGIQTLRELQAQDPDALARIVPKNLSQ